MGRLGSHPHIVTVFDLGAEPAASNEQRGAGRGLLPIPDCRLPRRGGRLSSPS